MSINTGVKPVLKYGLILEICLVGILFLGDLRQEIHLFLLLYCFAFVTFLIMVWRLYTYRPLIAGDPGSLPLIIFFALLFRVTLLFSAPSLSDDIFRYQWDGKLLNNGINPYRYVPGATELMALRDDHFVSINHKEIGTPYGPLSLIVFAISESINNSTVFMKFVFALFDCLTIFLIIKMLSIARLPPHNVLFYAWNPLVVVEVAGSGHNDSLGVLMLLLALLYVQRGKPIGTSISFAFALMTKYVALLFLPAVSKCFSRKEWFVFSISLIVGYFYFAPYMESHLLNLLQVGSDWRFNDSIFSLLLFITGSLQISKAIIFVVMLLLSVVIFYSRLTVLKSAMIMIGATLMLTTTMQPWYLLWMIPFLCFFPNRAWLLLTGLTMLSYHVLIRYDLDGVWVESLWVKLVIYLPFYLLLIADAYNAFIRKTVAHQVGESSENLQSE